MRFVIYRNPKDLPENWDKISYNHFLNRPYITAIYNACPDNMESFYVGIFQDDLLVAKSVVERFYLEGKKIFRYAKNSFQKGLQSLLNEQLLSVGNMMLTGENLLAKESNITWEEAFNELQNAVKEISRICKKEKKKIGLILYKDFYSELNKKTQKLLPSSYLNIKVQPNMIMDIPSEWNTSDDYLNAMKSKYRIRAKRAFKKLGKVEIKNLSLEEVISLQENIYNLYLNVASEAIFSAYEMPKNYFTELKRQMPNDYHIFGCFLHGELVSFYGVIDNHPILETGFLGYDPKYLHSHQLYLNMLYRMIEFGIEHNYSRIIFSRTALEIKSSVGAVPIETFDFIEHTQPIFNQILRKSFSYFSPKMEWEQRHPFK